MLFIILAFILGIIIGYFIPKLPRLNSLKNIFIIEKKEQQEQHGGVIILSDELEYRREQDEQLLN